MESRSAPQPPCRRQARGCQTYAAGVAQLLRGGYAALVPHEERCDMVQVFVGGLPLELIDSEEDRLLDVLREAAAEVGPQLTLGEFQRRTGVRPRQIRKYFGSWGAAREAVGLPRYTAPTPIRRYTDEEIVAKLAAAAAELGDDVTQAAFVRETGIDPSTLRRRFQSWDALRAAAGLPGRKRPAEHSRESIQHALRAFAAARGDDVRMTDFIAATGISQRAIYARCGSWSALRWSLGWSARKCTARQLSDETLLAAYHRVARELGRFPSTAELDRLTPYCATRYSRRFGTKPQVRRRYAEYLHELASRNANPPRERQCERGAGECAGAGGPFICDSPAM